jgi:molybdenum-dependent DNA-binding transcriptional regulator ModE
MDRDLLGHLPIIVCVARHRSFAAAAAELGMSPSAVSHAVRTVEDRLATPLFARTTRSVSLTEAGARFLASVEPALADIHQAIERLTADRGEVTGLFPNEEHAAVATRVDGEWLILDNRTLTLVRDTDVTRATPEFVLDHEGVKRFNWASRNRRVGS